MPRPLSDSTKNENKDKKSFSVQLNNICMQIEDKCETFKASGTLGNSTILLTPTARAFATCLHIKWKTHVPNMICSQRKQIKPQRPNLL